ncbi:hypothetical protein F5Y19DRAFT_472849 [Xylariaceae sp. FL1651]|nr:hypothetical protein F5Y19DRAFT_472849 [Xylariaceae sp. FL1651]
MTEEQLEQSWAFGNSHGFILPESFRWPTSSTLDYLDQARAGFQFLIVAEYLKRFGLLAAIPTDNAGNALAETARSTAELEADGLDRVWEELNRPEATVFVHTNAYAPPVLGIPVPLVEVTFETCRTVVSMLYSGHFLRFPDIRFIISHCGGALPAHRSRLELLGNEPHVPNSLRLSPGDIRKQLSHLYIDTAATCPCALGPAMYMTSPSHIVYGADCSVSCSTHGIVEANRLAILEYEGLSKEEIEAVGRNVVELFSKTAQTRTGTLMRGLNGDPLMRGFMAINCIYDGVRS